MNQREGTQRYTTTRDLTPGPRARTIVASQRPPSTLY
jgi:hypothetical protein